MARKKKEKNQKEQKDQKEPTTTLEKRIDETYGEGVRVSINDIKQQERIFFHSTIGLDSIIGGRGFAAGTMTILGGLPKVGKTSTVLQIARNAQKDRKTKVWYFKVEGRLQPELIDTLPELDDELTEIIQSRPGKILTGEDFLDIATDVILTKTDVMIIIDSIPALVSESEFAATMTSKERGALAKMLAQFMRKACNAWAVNRNTVFLITRMSQSLDGNRVMYMVGGINIRHHADFILSMRKGDKITSGDDTIGHWITYKTDASLDRPDQTVNVPLIYGHALDETFELMYLARAIGIVTAKGSWYTVETEALGLNVEPIKVQGEFNLWQALRDNEEVCKKMHEHVYGVYCK